jgi:aminoglycoside phosphotransferase (APT) family kinase protein
MAEVIPVRPGEELALEVLHPYLERIVPGMRLQDWTVHQYGAGHSNLTYLLRAPGGEVVLRRPPLGPVAPRAHDMVREYQILQALSGYYPYAPKVFGLEADMSPLGAPFFLMEAKEGLLVDETWMQEQPAAFGSQLTRVMADRLADLHRIAWRDTPLASMVKPDGFMERQAESWARRYQMAKTEDVPGDRELCQWLTNHVPDSGEAAVIHYDFKFNNVLFRPDLSDLAGVFDWEMATVGDPLADVGVAMSYWVEADDPPILQSALGERPVTAAPGFPRRRDWLEMYGRASGRDIHHFSYYLTFAYFKLAVIVAQIYTRYVRGQTQDPRFQHFGRACRELIAVALDARSL